MSLKISAGRYFFKLLIQNCVLDVSRYNVPGTYVVPIFYSCLAIDDINLLSVINFGRLEIRLNKFTFSNT